MPRQAQQASKNTVPQATSPTPKTSAANNPKPSNTPPAQQPAPTTSAVNKTNSGQPITSTKNNQPDIKKSQSNQPNQTSRQVPYT